MVSLVQSPHLKATKRRDEEMSSLESICFKFNQIRCVIRVKE
jgi:hypothetical protein